MLQVKTKSEYRQRELLESRGSPKRWRVCDSARAAKQKVRQQAVRSKQEDWFRSQKGAHQRSQITTWRKRIKGQAAEKSSSPQQVTTEDHGWTPHVISPEWHRLSENSQTCHQRDSPNSRTKPGSHGLKRTYKETSHNLLITSTISETQYASRYSMAPPWTGRGTSILVPATQPVCGIP